MLHDCATKSDLVHGARCCDLYREEKLWCIIADNIIWPGSTDLSTITLNCGTSQNAFPKTSYVVWAST